MCKESHVHRTGTGEDAVGDCLLVEPDDSKSKLTYAEHRDLSRYEMY